MPVPTRIPPADIKEQRFRFHTEPELHDPIEAMVALAFPCEGDPLSKTIALEFWLLGVVYIHRDEEVHIFPPECCHIDESGTLVVNLNHTKYAEGFGVSLRLEDGDYCCLLLDRDKCHTLPELDQDGEPGTDVVPWMEEWLRASNELKDYLQAG